MGQKAILKHTVTAQEIEQFAGMGMFFQEGQLIDVHVPIPSTEPSALTASVTEDDEAAVTPDGYVGTRPGQGRP